MYQNSPMAQFANPYFAMNGNPVSTIDPTGGSGHAVQSGNIKASENEVTDYSMPLWDEGSPGGGSNGFGAHGYGSSYESGEAAWGSLFVDPGTESTMRGAAPCYDAMNNSYSYSDMVGAAVAQQYRCGGADNVNQATLNAYYNTNTSLAAIPEGTNLDITPSGGIGYYKNSEDVYTSGPGRSFTDGGWVELGGFGGGQSNQRKYTEQNIHFYYTQIATMRAAGEQTIMDPVKGLNATYSVKGIASVRREHNGSYSLNIGADGFAGIMQDDGVAIFFGSASLTVGGVQGPSQVFQLGSSYIYEQGRTPIGTVSFTLPNAPGTVYLNLMFGYFYKDSIYDKCMPNFPYPSSFSKTIFIH